MLILFHKYLSIKQLTSIDDKKEDEKRFRFNIPFGFIDFHIFNSNYFLQNKLAWGEKLFIWLDYDTQIVENMLGDIEYVSSKAKPLDIFIITIEGESPEKPESFIEAFSKHISPRCSVKEIKEGYTKTLNMIVNGIIKKGLGNQPKKVNFLPLFNFEYKDTKKMYTYGGIFCDENNPKEKLKKYVSELSYISLDTDKIVTIDCPLLTPREKMYLDSQIQKSGDLNSDTDKIGLRKEDLDKYKKYYKFYPQFFESIY